MQRWYAMATINGISNTGAPAPVLQKSKVRTESSEGSTAPTKTSGDSLVLTDILAQVNAVSGFDASKVEDIKRAIASGNYPIDARSIAQNFAALEHLVGNSGAK